MPEEKDRKNMTNQIDSKYRLVVVVADRSKQLQSGAKPRVQTTAKKATSIALEEAQQGLIWYEQKIARIPTEE